MAAAAEVGRLGTPARALQAPLHEGVLIETTGRRRPFCPPRGFLAHLWRLVWSHFGGWRRAICSPLYASTSRRLLAAFFFFVVFARGLGGVTLRRGLLFRSLPLPRRSSLSFRAPHSMLSFLRFFYCARRFVRNPNAALAQTGEKGRKTSIRSIAFGVRRPKRQRGAKAAGKIGENAGGGTRVRANRSPGF